MQSNGKIDHHFDFDTISWLLDHADATSGYSSSMQWWKPRSFSKKKIAHIVICIFLILILMLTYFTMVPILRIDWSSFKLTPSMYDSKRLKLKNRIGNYSKFRCTGDENNIGKWSDRLCVFNNICYNVHKQQFQFYQPSRDPKFPLFYDGKKGMLADFGDSFVSLTSRGAHAWAPQISYQSVPLINVTWLANLHTLWKEYFGSDPNFGHLVWEDMGSISYSLDRMNENDDQLVIMHVDQVSTDVGYQKILDNILVALTKNKLVEYKSYLNTFNSSYVCFQRFLVGGNLNLINAAGRKETDGKEPLLYRWRSKIISYHKFDPDHIPTHHRFLITNKSASVWAKTPNGVHRAIANLVEVVNFVKETYPKIPVDVIEWHKISMNKQVELLNNTTLLISPAGGVSMISPLLPRGSHAILMDYYATQNSFGYEAGASVSMEGMLLNHFPHFKKDYYQVYGADDYVFDFPGAHDTRNDASIRVNVTRLRLLIESALEDMNL